MKKIILFFIFLLIPFNVFAENELPEHGFVDRFSFSFLSNFSASEKKLYSFSYTYNNGRYYLGDTILNDAKRLKDDYYSEYPSHVAYTCNSQTDNSCTSLYAVHMDILNYSNHSYPAITLNGGEELEDKWTFLGSKEFHKEGEFFVLDNPQDFLVTDSIRRNYDFIGNYFCEDRSARCKNLYYIEQGDEISLMALQSNNDFIYGHGFDYNNGKYILKDIIESKWPKYDQYVGSYTCMSHENTCDTLYQINSFINAEYYHGSGTFDMFDPSHFNGVKVKTNFKEVSIDKKNSYELKEYLNNNSSIWIEDESIVLIEDGIIKPRKVGKTNIIIKNDEEVFLFKINITEEDLENPTTNRNVVILILLLSFVLIFTIIFKKSIYNK